MYTKLASELLPIVNKDGAQTRVVRAWFAVFSIFPVLRVDGCIVLLIRCRCCDYGYIVLAHGAAHSATTLAQMIRASFAEPVVAGECLAIL